MITIRLSLIATTSNKALQSDINMVLQYKAFKFFGNLLLRRRKISVLIFWCGPMVTLAASL